MTPGSLTVLRTVLVIAADALTVGANLPYILAVRARAARPRLVTWLMFAVATATAAAGSFRAGQWPAGIFTAVLSAGCLGVLAAGWRHGNRQFGRLDAACLVLGSTGVALLAIAVVRPAAVPVTWALSISILTDLVAFLPTFAHGWRAPAEEPRRAWAMFTAGAALALAASQVSSLDAVLWPAWVLAADGFMLVLVLAGPARARRWARAEQHGPAAGHPGAGLAATGPRDVLPAMPRSAEAGARYRGLVLAVCCTSLFMVGLDNTIVNVGLPAIGRSLHAQVTGLQWTVAAYTVTLAILLMFSGTLADRIGRRTVFQIGLALFTLGSWLCSNAPALGWLIAFRVIQGIGGSMLNPSALGIITNTFTRPAGRARAIGVWDGVFGLSMALGPVLGGALVNYAGWRGIFWANIPVGLTAIALTALFVPDSRAARARRPDPAGQVLLASMLAALAAALIEGPDFGWRAPATLGLFALAAASLAALIRLEQRRREPLLELRLFRSAPFTGAALIAVCAIAALAGFLFLTTLYLQDVRGLSGLRAGLTILPMPATMALTAPLAGWIVARRGPRIPMVTAGIAFTLSSAALSQLTRATPAVFLVITYSLFGLGAGMINSPITYGIMSGVPKAQAGLASGLNSASRQIGQLLGVALIGSVLAGSLRGPLRSGFVPASHPSWWIMASCGYAVLLLGLGCTTRWALSTGIRGLAADQDLGPPARPNAIPEPVTVPAADAIDQAARPAPPRALTAWSGS